MTMTRSQRATSYAERFGWSVFPLTTIDGDACSCGKKIWTKQERCDSLGQYCASPGKHPIGSLTPQGVLNATTDPQMIREWWAVYPDANIGIATGDASGVIVVDIDPDHGGETSLRNLESRFGLIPETWTVETGGGGLHLYFQMPPVNVRNSAGAVGPGIDVRGNGGYVVAPPSAHASGTPYRWMVGHTPQAIAVAPLPSWVIERTEPAGMRTVATLPRKIAEGQRNVVLTSAAGTMRRKGFCEAAIVAALLIENKDRCSPPLDRREVERIAKSIERYAPEPVVTVGGRQIA